MIIGIPKEIMKNENRVAALPETVSKYCKLGFKVIIESGAGKGVYIKDEEYAKAGAEVVKSPSDVFAKSDIVLKVKEPLFNEQLGKHEIDMLKNGQTIITFLHPAAPSNHGSIRKLAEKNVTAFTMDGIPRTSRAQKMDALTSMSTITGYKSILIAANHYPKFVPLIGTAIGMTKPANFLMIGCGVVGLQAIAAAKRMGGVIKAVDIREDARKEAESLGAKSVGFEVPKDLALGDGGYAKSLPSDWLAKERDFIKTLAADADVIVLSALVPGEIAPTIINDEVLKVIKPGSAIIDVSIDQGGNCSLTKPGEETVINDVFICGIKNIPGSLPVHSSWLYANNIYNYVENLFKRGIPNYDFDDDIVQNSLVTRNGKIVHKGTLKALGELK